LQPDDPPRWALDLLLEEQRRVMLVGHMPQLPRLLRLLVTGTPDADQPDFPPHGIVELSAQGESRWIEVWRDQT
jgi:phosphohistidine phosphatase SixA